MQIFRMVLGFSEILIALIAVFLSVSVFLAMLGDEPYAGEWGVLLLTIDLIFAVSFGWAGYALVAMKPRASFHQIFPLAAIVLVAAFLFWSDSV